MRREKEDTKEHISHDATNCRDYRLSFLLFYNYTHFGYTYSPTVIANDHYVYRIDCIFLILFTEKIKNFISFLFYSFPHI